MIFIFANDIGEQSLVPSYCFGAILQKAMYEYGTLKSYRDFQNLLLSKDIDINEKRIAEYSRGEYTPPLEKARAMLNCLEYEISEEELLDSLRANRAYSKTRVKGYRVKGDREISINTRVKMSTLLPEVDPDRTILLLQNRIFTLFGGSGNYSDYVRALISKDLKELILDEDTITDGGKDR